MYKMAFLVDGSGKDATTPVLLLLYEFEARSKLGDPSVDKLLEKAARLPQPEPKIFETMAGELIDQFSSVQPVCRCIFGMVLIEF